MINHMDIMQLHREPKRVEPRAIWREPALPARNRLTDVGITSINVDASSNVSILQSAIRKT
jgi:hypothetical protein